MKVDEFRMTQTLYYLSVALQQVDLLKQMVDHHLETDSADPEI